MELAIEGDAVKLRNFTNPTKKNHRKIVTSTFDFAIDSIIERVEQGAIQLKQITGRPEFQKNYVWNEEKASKLVESILLSVPIPACYFSEDKKYNWYVIDGQQRIHSLYRFVKGEFILTGLKAFNEFNGYKYSDLPESIKEIFNVQMIRCIIIKNDSHPKIKFDVFERLNANSTPLKAQEIRNCIYQGKFNDMLGKLANEETWLLIRNKDHPDRRLADDEIVLRFFSFILQDRNDYYSPLQDWLNDTAIIGNELTSSELKICKKIWVDTLNKSLVWFEPKECFRRPDTGRFNMAVFDLVSYSANKLDFDSIREVKSPFRKKFKKLFRKTEFVSLFDHSADKKSRTLERIRLWNREMSELGL